MGTRHRVSGTLRSAPRGLLLEMDDGGVYVLDAEPGAAKMVGSRVTVEGVRVGFDRLAVEWLGLA